MYYRSTFIVASLLLMIFFRPASAEVDMKNGMWEVTTKWEIPGMPMGMEMSSAKFNQCLTDENNVPRSNGENGECKITHSEVNGNTVFWEMQCTGQGQDMTGIGKITYSGDTFTGGMTIEAEGMNMTQHLSGRRIGDCK